ncbi:hypothetical protein WJX84_008996 [Apatococcus fuscideae]|uniref:Uncharacterized protein n=1 Tax=Apatococcus fuscideae TaxID=2026836 RepID=A0AAW1SSX8_9CHLO
MSVLECFKEVLLGREGICQAPRPNRADQMMREVNKAAAMIDMMMDEIGQKLVIDGAVEAFLGRDPGEALKQEVVDSIVRDHLEELGEVFLYVLDAFSAAASEKGDPETAGLMGRIKAAVLQQISARLPIEMQVLNAVLLCKSSGDRVEVVRKAAEGKEAGLPKCEPHRLQLAVSQLLDDMEEKEAIPDRKLLARLCLVREELQNELLNQAFGQGQGAKAAQELEENMRLLNQLLPTYVAAFVKDLISVGSSERRSSLIKAAFVEDPSMDSRAKVETDPRAWVRPGRFLACVQLTQQELQRRSDKSGTPPPASVMERLEAIRRESLLTLQDIAGEHDANG